MIGKCITCKKDMEIPSDMIGAESRFNTCTKCATQKRAELETKLISTLNTEQQELFQEITSLSKYIEMFLVFQGLHIKNKSIEEDIKRKAKKLNEINDF